MTQTRFAPVLATVCFLLLGCSGGPERDPGEAPAPLGEVEVATTGERQPRLEMVASLRKEITSTRHASDGGGRAWLAAPAEAEARAGGRGRWTLFYEAGPLGVAVGGAVYLQVSPFWGWSTPQVERPELPGFTEVSTEAEGVELEPRTVDQQLLAVLIRGRALGAGERLRIDYGAGTAGAAADRFAERGERFWFAVDGDGDGVRSLLADSPKIAVAAGPAAQLVAILPSTARPGEAVRLHLSVLDTAGNAGVPFAGEISLQADADLGASLSPVRFEPADLGTRVVELRPTATGVLRLRAEGPGGLATTSNPLQVSASGRLVFWGDLQNHSNFSDGTALPEQLYDYARDVAGLDVMSVTDHDHWGLLFLDRHPEMWRHLQEVTEAYHRDGRFITVRGFEWTNWIHGHRHVLVFDDAPLEILSSIDEAMDHPDELWAALEGRQALTLAHHSAGGPISTDWSIPPDPRFETVTEVVSVHGSSEAADSPKLIYRPVAGNFVRDALRRGYRLGFLGSSDGHDGHPGLGHLASGVGGLAAILADELTRDGVYRALVARRCYATSGVRILLRTVYGGYQMGAAVPLAAGVARREKGDAVEVPVVPADQLFVQAVAPGPLERIDVVRSGTVNGAFDCAGELACTFALTVEDLEPGETLYVRAVQADGHFAVSSPFFF